MSNFDDQYEMIHVAGELITAQCIKTIDRYIGLVASAYGSDYEHIRPIIIGVVGRNMVMQGMGGLVGRLDELTEEDAPMVEEAIADVAKRLNLSEDEVRNRIRESRDMVRGK